MLQLDGSQEDSGLDCDANQPTESLQGLSADNFKTEITRVVFLACDTVLIR